VDAHDEVPVLYTLSKFDCICNWTVYRISVWNSSLLSTEVTVVKASNNNPAYLDSQSAVIDNKKLSYRRVTARCVLSVVILPIAMQQCRNYLYDKSWPNWWYEVGGLVGGNVSWTMCTQPWRDGVGSHCLSGVINIPTTVELCISPVYLLWRNFLSPQRRNCSRDPDHAHLGNREHSLITRLRLHNHMADPCTKSEVSSVSRCGDIRLHGVQNSKTGYLTLTTPLSGKIFLWQGGSCYSKLMYQIWSL